jgi:hypothetical protein
MAFLRTFTALTVAGLIWMALFVEFGEARNSVLNSIADWLSPNFVTGWLFYVVLCIVCFLIAQRLMGHDHEPPPGNSER